jgi:hypothetical protein
MHRAHQLAATMLIVQEVYEGVVSVRVWGFKLRLHEALRQWCLLVFGVKD